MAWNSLSILLFLSGMVEVISTFDACEKFSKRKLKDVQSAYSMPWVGLGASRKSGRGGDDSIEISSSGVLTGVGD